MAGQAGRNWGVTGIIDLGGTAPQIQGHIDGFAAALLAELVELTGPGSAYAKKFYSSNVGGSGTAEGFVLSAVRPFPSTLHNLAGNLIHQEDAGCTITMPVLIQSLSCRKDAKTADRWRVSIAWTKAGQETVAWIGAAPTYTQPTLAYAELFADTQKVTDPNALQSQYTVKGFLPIPAVVSPAAANYTDAAGNAAVDAWIAAATAPRAGLKIVNVMLLRLDDGAGLIIAQWGLRDTVDDAVLPVTMSTRSASQPWTAAVGVIVDSSDTDDDEATTQWNTFQGIAYAWGLRITSLNTSKKLCIFDYLNPGIQFQGLTGADDRYIECQLDGSGNVQLYVQSNCALGGGYREFTFSRQRSVDKRIRRFVVARMLKGIAIPEGAPSTIGTSAVTMPAIGNINSGSFQGIAAKLCVYKGPLFTVNISLSTPRVMLMGWQFFSDDNGIFTSIPQELFRAPIVRASSSTVVDGWETLANLGISATAIVQPTAASFAAFTAAGDVCS